MKAMLHRLLNEPIVAAGVIAAALDSYDGDPSWEGIAAAVLMALGRFVVTGPLTNKED